MEILDVRWFSGTSCVGVVRVSDPYDGIKYYVGTGTGMEEEIDMEYIAAWGARFPNNVGDIMFGIDPVRSGDAVMIPVNRQHAEAMVKVGMHYLETMSQ